MPPNRTIEKWITVWNHIVRAAHDARGVVDELGGDGRGKILVVVAIGWFLSIGIRFSYPALVPFFRGEFGFDLKMAGLLLSGLWAAYALGQFPGGLAGDRYGEGTILVTSTVVAAIMLLVVVLSTELWMLFVGTLGFGIATSLYGPTRFTILTDVFGDRAGTAVGLSHASGSVGNTVLPVLAAGIASYASWRAGLGIMIPVFVVVAIALAVFVPTRTSPSSRTNSGSSLRTIRRIAAGISVRGIPVVLAIQILIGFVSQGFLGFYPTYLIEVKGFSPGMATALFGLYFAIAIVIQPLTGLSTDRFGSRSTLAVLLGAYFVGLAALYFAQSILQMLVLTVLLSHRNGMGVITNTIIADRLFDDVKGSGLGLLRSTWILIGAAGPVVVGLLGDVGLFSQVFLLLALGAGIAALLTFFLPRTF